MKREAVELQERAVAEILSRIESNECKTTFKAPTGSGKTYMMADLMNQYLQKYDDAIFLISCLSTAGLAIQNYSKFKEYQLEGKFSKIKPYLINTNTTEEESVYIPLNYNVYVLPRDLYKQGGKLMEGALQNFLTTMTQNYFGVGLNKRIILIRDESHQATNNLSQDSNKIFFSQTINFSATPKEKADVEIKDEEAVKARLIKDVIWCPVEDGEEHLDEALKKFHEIKEKYRSMKVNPCLIIQISNENKADEEWNNIIRKELDKAENGDLTWMYIVSDDKKCKTNDKIGFKPVSVWKEYARQPMSTIDIIIFKMVIKEGWDIPRACMLYQIRATTSKQLDEQVVGRVRRNPRLLDYEDLDNDQKKLASQAWVWGIKNKDKFESTEVKLYEEKLNAIDYIKVKTTKLKDLNEPEIFDEVKFIEEKEVLKKQSIFDLYKQLNGCDDELRKLCYKYTGDDYTKWLRFTKTLPKLKKSYKTFKCDYSKNMVYDKTVSFPVESSYTGNENSAYLSSWLWIRKDGGEIFAFDSKAEEMWANFLNSITSSMSALNGDEETHYLWGKNYPLNSEICYQYYDEGEHFSYPDFVMKDKFGRIHIFEVKSLNEKNSSSIDTEEYKKKIEELKKCYKACSEKLKDHFFYIPILDGGNWNINLYVDGKEKDNLCLKDVSSFINTDNNYLTLFE